MMKAAGEKPTAQEIEAAVIRIAAKQAEVDASLVTPETRFAEDLNFDSLDRVEFVMTLEETFDVSIGDADAEQVRTVGEAARLVAASGGGRLENRGIRHR